MLGATCAGDRVKASPYARKLAREAGVDVAQATATGPEGRIVAADVQKLISSGGGKPAAKSASAPAASQQSVRTFTTPSFTGQPSG